MWLRYTDEGSPALEETREVSSSAIDPPDQDPDLKGAAEALGLSVL